MGLQLKRKINQSFDHLLEGKKTKFLSFSFPNSYYSPVFLITSTKGKGDNFASKPKLDLLKNSTKYNL